LIPDSQCCQVRINICSAPNDEPASPYGDAASRADEVCRFFPGLGDTEMFGGTFAYDVYFRNGRSVLIVDRHSLD